MANIPNMEIARRDADAVQQNAWNRHIAIPAVVAAVGAKRGRPDQNGSKPVVHSVLR